MLCSPGLSEVISVDQASFKLVVSLLWLPPKTGITGMRRHAWPDQVLSKQLLSRFRTEYFCFTVYHALDFTQGPGPLPLSQFAHLPCRASQTSLAERAFAAHGIALVSWKLPSRCHVIALCSHPT